MHMATQDTPSASANATATAVDLTPERTWLSALEEGRFLLQRSASSGQYVFHPRVAEPRTGATDLAWVEACGDGVVYAVTVIAPKPPAAPYTVALIDLAEGPRVMGRVEGMAPDQVRIGMAVKARVGRIDGVPAVLFDPREERHA